MQFVTPMRCPTCLVPNVEFLLACSWNGQILDFIHKIVFCQRKALIPCDCSKIHCHCHLVKPSAICIIIFPNSVFVAAEVRSVLVAENEGWELRFCLRVERNDGDDKKLRFCLRTERNELRLFASKKCIVLLLPQLPGLE